MKLYAEDLVRVFRESTSLQTVDLKHPYIVLPADDVEPEKESIPLLYLRVFNISDVDTKAQQYLMSPLIFPPGCTIGVVRDSQNFQTDPILHPDILNRFRPLRFVELQHQENLLNLAENPNDQRASLHLVSTHRPEDVDCRSIDSSLGLSSVRTITFSGSMSVQFLENLLQYTPSVTNIVVSRTRTAQLILPNITPILAADQDLLRNLQTLELCGIHFDASILAFVQELLHHCRDVGREIQTLTLRKCRLDAGGNSLTRLGELVAKIRLA